MDKSVRAAKLRPECFHMPTGELPGFPRDAFLAAMGPGVTPQCSAVHVGAAPPDKSRCKLEGSPANAVKWLRASSGVTWRLGTGYHRTEVRGRHLPDVTVPERSL